MTMDQPAAKMPPLWVIKTRAPFFTAAIVPVLLGTVAAWTLTGAFNLWYFMLTLIGSICLHAGTNMTNDYFDHIWGSDEVNTEFANPFTGGSRLIQLGIVEPKVYLRQGIGFFVAGSLIGLLLFFTRGPWVLWLGLIGVFSGYFYTAPPFRLVRMGLGELLIGLCFGPLMVLGSYYTQTQTVSWEPVIASLPVGLLITLVVWINQFQDMKADASVGKNHWVVRLGRQRSTLVFGISLAAVYISMLAGVLFAGVTPLVLMGFLTLPIALKAYRVASVHYDHPKELIPANAATIQVHMLTGLLMTVGYIIQGIIG